MTTPQPNIEQKHYQEWLASGIDRGMIGLNVRPLEGELAGVDGEYSLALAEFLNIPIRPKRWINRKSFKNLAYSFQLLTYSTSRPTGGAS